MRCAVCPLSLRSKFENARSSHREDSDAVLNLGRGRPARRPLPGTIDRGCAREARRDMHTAGDDAVVESRPRRPWRRPDDRTRQRAVAGAVAERLRPRAPLQSARQVVARRADVEERRRRRASRECGRARSPRRRGRCPRRFRPARRQATSAKTLRAGDLDADEVPAAGRLPVARSRSRVPSSIDDAVVVIGRRIGHDRHRHVGAADRDARRASARGRSRTACRR